MGLILSQNVNAGAPPDRGEVLQNETPTPISSKIPTPLVSPAGTQIKPAPKAPDPNLAQSSLPIPLHAIEEKMSEAIESGYSNKLPLLLKKWPPENIDKKWEENPRPIWVRGIRTQGNSTYIGTEKQILIHADLKRVSSVMLDFESYPSFFHDLKQVRVTLKEGNKISTSWERYPPIFFLPNIKYEQVYIVESTEHRVVIRYQLKSASDIKSADGLVVLEAEGNSTRLTAFDFFDAKWGLLGGIASGNIWHGSFENSQKDDIAFKTHTEHPDWNRDQIYKECDRVLDLFPVDPIQFVDAPNWNADASH
jgi:hypothetical protein